MPGSEEANGGGGQVQGNLVRVTDTTCVTESRSPSTGPFITCSLTLFIFAEASYFQEFGDL